MSAISHSNVANAGSVVSSTVSKAINPVLFTLGVLPVEAPYFPSEFELADGRGGGLLPLTLFPRDDMEDNEFFLDSVIGWETNGCEFGFACI